MRKTLRRPEGVLCAVLAIASTAGAANLEVIGVKAKIVDCHDDGELQIAKPPELRKEDWPRERIRVQDQSEDGLLVVVHGRRCWIDRSQVVLDVPDAKECRTQGQFGSRGIAEEEECVPVHKRERR